MEKHTEKQNKLKCQKRKDAMRLRLLLSFLQNCVTEPLQRIPSMITALVAEASFILLDSSHDHYAAISKCLVQFAGANAKVLFYGLPLLY